MLSKERRDVLRGILLGVVIVVLAFAMARHWPLWQAKLGAAPLAVLQWDLLPALCLAGNIALIARHRFVTPEDLDGNGLTTGSAQLRVYQAMLQNTLEQTVLALATHLLWALTMPPTRQGAIAVAALLFVAGRLLFWRGYAAGATTRAVGFALTFYPCFAMLLGIGVYLVFHR
ncbi:MAPEG family protein [Neisseriaceae bacterium JH1-16]|nr:MAPEG family protein [Neisseriaceae bacterium JH1-16]